MVYVRENRTSNQDYKELTGWWIVNNEDIVWEKPVPYILFNADEDISEDVPAITLRADSTVVEVWETVTFRAISEILSDSADFEKNRTFYYDFDWNWTWDLVTKQDEIKYTYIDSYEKGVTPRVAVEYKWKLGQAKWATLLVVNKWDFSDLERGKDEEIMIQLNTYEMNKLEILALLPTKWDIKQTIGWMFNEFEENLFMYNQKEKTKELEKIWNVIIKDGKKNKWMSAESDFTPYFCNIFDYYSIADYADKC